MEQIIRFNIRKSRKGGDKMTKFNNDSFDIWVKDTMKEMTPASFLTRAKNMSQEHQNTLFEMICHKCCFRTTPEVQKIFNELIKEEAK